MSINAVTQNLVALAEQSDQVVFIYDIASQKFSYLNLAFEKVWRKKRKSGLNNPVSLVKMIHPEDQQYVKRVYRELLEGIIIPEVDFRIRLGNHNRKMVMFKTPVK